ncbi:hypothetical protein QOY93_02200 [Leclercia adecarboxylata]|uniref:hypothetical protein n=1 Tax=Leclercia adecarboxylata TaxID=83655 RepID=UPI00254B1E42|nr:hypothetical protein [Leclercia adecarboxylata]MDK4744198.1 hypothetical protein [Leclercia adecarboxylata]
MGGNDRNTAGKWITGGWDPKFDSDWLKYSEVKGEFGLSKEMLPSKIPGAMGNTSGSFTSEFGSSIIQQKMDGMDGKKIKSFLFLIVLMVICIFGLLFAGTIFYLLLEIFLYFYINVPISFDPYQFKKILRMSIWGDLGLGFGLLRIFKVKGF